MLVNFVLFMRNLLLLFSSRLFCIKIQCLVRKIYKVYFKLLKIYNKNKLFFAFCKNFFFWVLKIIFMPDKADLKQ